MTFYLQQYGINTDPELSPHEKLQFSRNVFAIIIQVSIINLSSSTIASLLEHFLLSYSGSVTYFKIPLYSSGFRLPS